MATNGQGIPPKSPTKAPNRGGRPRKHTTVEEAKEHKIAKQKQKRLQQQQSRDSKAGHAIPKALQFIPYHPPSTEPSSGRSTATVKDEQEPHTSTLKSPPVPPPPLLLQQQAIQGIRTTTPHGSPASKDVESTAGIAPSERGSNTYPRRNENLLHPADTTIEAAVILSSMPFYLPAQLALECHERS
jgi:hypothetical protein